MGSASWAYFIRIYRHQRRQYSLYLFVLTPKIHRDTGEVDSEVCFFHLCLPWLPTKKKSQAGMSPGPGRSMGENDPAAKLQGKKDKTPPRFKVPKPARIEATSTRLFFAFCF